MAEMAVHGVRREEEAFRDLAIGHAFGNKARDGKLGARQRCPPAPLGLGGDEAAPDPELAQVTSDAARVQAAPSSV